jgi:ferredoxin
MASTIRKAVIVYFSPAGSTARIARAIEKKVATFDTPVVTIDLGREPDIPFIIPQLLDACDNMCLYIGSPVYAAYPVPPVMEFISLLPQARNGFCVPFVTWGGVTSGIALVVMAKALHEKGYAVLGAAKVLARHSLMWDCQKPLGGNHPNAEDEHQVEALVAAVFQKLKTATPEALPLKCLDYQPAEIRKKNEARNADFNKPRFPKPELIRERCNGCGICEQICPVEGALVVSDYPEFGSNCVWCLSCVRLCPENALRIDLSGIHAHIRNRAERFNEHPPTQVFF